MRVMLDANVLVSGIIRPNGKPAQVIRRAVKEFEWLTTQYILAEVEDVLLRRHIQKKYQEQVGAQNRAEYFRKIDAEAEIVETIRAIPTVSRDENDDPVLASAADGHADYIVTGDKDLLTLGEFEGIPIVTPEQFLQILDEAKKKAV